MVRHQLGFLLSDPGKPSDTMKITEALHAEHIVFHHMFDHVEAIAMEVKTLAEIKALSGMMESMLRLHSDTEDDLFLGPLEHCFEQIGQRDAYLKEHEEMDGSLQKVQDATRLDTARKILLHAISHSRKHFEKEERIVFPMAEKVLKRETLEALGK